MIDPIVFSRILFPLGSALIVLLTLTSCISGPSWYDDIRNPGSSYYTAHWDGRRNYSEPKHDIRINQPILDRTNPSNARLEISLREQKVRLYKEENGRRQVSVETPISTGKEEYRTPSGDFTVLEKLPKKKSSLYGFWVDGNTGEVLDRDGDSRRPPSGRSNLEFRGAPMPYWLRLTNGGIGIHEGFVPDHPASHGCIRIPGKAQQLIYDKVRVGTPVSVRY